MDSHWIARIPNKAKEKKDVYEIISSVLAEPWTYNIFGSKTSRDYDIMIFYTKNIFDRMAFDKIRPHILHFLAKAYESFLQETLRDKPLNVNFAATNDEGELIWAFKGSPDECNNSIYQTYSLHDQIHPCAISHLIERNIGSKIIGGTRDIVSAISRSQFRSIVRPVIRNDVDFKDRLAIMRELAPKWDELIFYQETTPMYPKRKIIDIRTSYKKLTFQMGQILGLLHGIEYYDKVDISDAYPELSPFLLINTLKEDDVPDDFTLPSKISSPSGFLFRDEEVTSLKDFICEFVDILTAYCDEHPEIYDLKEVLQGK